MTSSPSTERPIVILISGRSPLEELGGGHCAYVRAHGFAAVAAGYEVHVFALSNQRSDTVSQPYGTVHHCQVPSTPIRQRYILSLAGPLANAIVSEKLIWSRAVCMHSFGVWAEAGVRAASQLKPEKTIYHILSLYTVYRTEVWAQLQALQGMQPRAFLRKLIEALHVQFRAAPCQARSYRQVDHIVLNYDCVRALVVKELGPHPRMDKRPYCPESAFKETRPRANTSMEPIDPPLILTVALQRPKKGIPILIQALAHLRKRGVSFQARIIGKGESRDRNIRLTAAEDLSAQVSFPGYIENLSPHFGEASIYVQPSIREESGSLALLEAMDAGCPVICSAIDGMAEDVRNGIDGLTVPPGDAEALANALETLLKNPDQRHRMGTAARSRYPTRNNKEAFVASHQALYEHARTWHDPSH